MNLFSGESIDYADLSAAIDVNKDPSDEIVDWEEVRSALES